MTPPIAWDDEERGFTIIDIVCCGQPMTAVGCGAASCRGLVCEVCRAGCDADNPRGRCVRGFAAERPVDRDARNARERAAFGGRRIGGGGL